jgi:hypothetical protein
MIASPAIGRRISAREARQVVSRMDTGVASRAPGLRAGFAQRSRRAAASPHGLRVW